MPHSFVLGAKRSIHAELLSDSCNWNIEVLRGVALKGLLRMSVEESA
jgi:hypothetical protein